MIMRSLSFEKEKKNCPQKVTNCTLVQVHRMALGRQRVRPNDLSVKKTVCESWVRVVFH